MSALANGRPGRPRTLLIGLDGATFHLLDRYMAEGVTPALAELTRRGVRAELRSTPHPFTPPAWTSLMTGANPGEHGIFDFVRVLPGHPRPHYTMATARDVRRETIWSVANREGVRVACLNFPLMFPPRPIDGCVVPGFVPPRHLRRFVHPPSLYDRLCELPGFDAAELLLNLDIERESLQTLEEDRYEEWIELHIRREAQWASISHLVLEEETCDLVAVIFDGVDKLQHLCWRFLDPDIESATDRAFSERIESLCLEYFGRLDRHVAELVAAAGEDANVVVCSDHGFGPTDEIFYANVLLEREGLLAWADGVAPDRQGKQMTEGHRNPTVLFDWEQTLAYALTAGSNGVYVRVAGEQGQAGVRPEEYEGFRRRVADALLAYRDPATGRAPVQRVLIREVAFPGEHAELAPDLTLILRDHGFLSILRADDVVAPRRHVMGTHAPDGVFLARGPALRSAASGPAFGIAQVGPLLLHLAGVPIPVDMEAALPDGVLDEGWLAAHAPKIGAPSDVPDPYFDEGDGGLGRSGEDQVLDRLRALGYVE